VPLIKVELGSFLVDSEVVVEDTRLTVFVSAVVADRGSKESSLHKSV